jgi:Nucleotidyltransferase of unknown function (DUF6036)
MLWVRNTSFVRAGNLTGRARTASKYHYSLNTLELATPDQILQFLTRLGETLIAPAELYIFGGSALLLVGGRRNTADIDYSLRSTALDSCRQTIATVAAELELDVEESEPSEFLPLAPDADSRNELLGQFGQLTAYLLDPYSIAAMKIDRAFPSDMQDVRSLISLGKVDLSKLEQYIRDIARRYDEPIRLRRNFEEFRRMVGS